MFQKYIRYMRENFFKLLIKFKKSLVLNTNYFLIDIVLIFFCNYTLYISFKGLNKVFNIKNTTIRL